MFSFLKRKEEPVRVIDKVWVSQTAKRNGILEIWRKDPQISIIAWFPLTLQELQTLFIQENAATVPLHLVREVHSSQLTGKPVIFAEHHPLRSKEQELYKQWQLKEATVHSALDEPFFKKYGGDRVVRLMKLLDMNESEAAEHTLISNAIRKWQKKTGKKVLTEHPANSQQEWMERNFSPEHIDW